MKGHRDTVDDVVQQFKFNQRLQLMCFQWAFRFDDWKAEGRRSSHLEKSRITNRNIYFTVILSHLVRNAINLYVKNISTFHAENHSSRSLNVHMMQSLPVAFLRAAIRALLRLLGGNFMHCPPRTSELLSFDPKHLHQFGESSVEQLNSN